MKSLIAITIASCIAFITSISLADEKNHSNEILEQANQNMSNPNTSPIRRIERDRNKYKKHPKRIFYRSIDGSDNNLDKVDMNKAKTPLMRITDQGYSDGSSAMAGMSHTHPN